MPVIQGLAVFYVSKGYKKDILAFVADDFERSQGTKRKGSECRFIS